MALIRLRICAGWSEPVLIAHTTLLEISCRGSFVNRGLHVNNICSERKTIWTGWFSYSWTKYQLSVRKKSRLIYFRNEKIVPRHEISNNIVCATSKCSDQPVHMYSLIRAFACRLNMPKLKRRLHGLAWVYLCQNVTLLEITCRG